MSPKVETAPQCKHKKDKRHTCDNVFFYLKKTQDSLDDSNVVLKNLHCLLCCGVTADGSYLKINNSWDDVKCPKL